MVLLGTLSRALHHNINGRIMTDDNHNRVTFTGKSAINSDSFNLIVQLSVDDNLITCELTQVVLQDINPVTRLSGMQEQFVANQSTLLLVIQDMLDNGHQPPLTVTTERVNEWRNRTTQL
ncbi:MAG: hypothetical protein RL594_473 [Bacteroidota bacterium]